MSTKVSPGSSSAHRPAARFLIQDQVSRSRNLLAKQWTEIRRPSRLRQSTQPSRARITVVHRRQVELVHLKADGWDLDAAGRIDQDALTRQMAEAVAGRRERVELTTEDVAVIRRCLGFKDRTP